MKRKIYLENQDGARIALNGENNLYFVDAAGFGVDVSDSFADFGYGFFTNTNSKNHPQQTLTGTLVFKGLDTLKEWQSFVNWVMTAEKLYFVYVPVDCEYRREVEVKFFTKGERKVCYLEVAASFTCLTPWYRETPVKVSMQTQASNAMRYSWTYNATVYANSGGADMSAEVQANGHLPSAIVFEFDGEIVNPVLKLTDENGSVLGECALTASVSGLTVSTLYRDSYVRSGGTDLLSSLDITKEEPFFHIPLGIPCTISITASSATGEARVSVYDYYRSV